MKRVMTAFLAAVISLSFLAGCSDDESSNSFKKTTKTTSFTQTQTEKATETTAVSRTTSETKQTSKTPVPTQQALTTAQRPVTTTTRTTQTTTVSTTTTTGFSMTLGAYSVIMNGYKVTVGMDITGMITELGTLEATVSQNGNTSIYPYKGCVITAYSGYVKQISVTSADIITDTGLTVGSPEEEIEFCYPDAVKNGSTVQASSGSSTIQFNIDEGKITLITLLAS